ncbi:DUF484 family protein [Nitrogeniibacter mangrovi]|uniref:DUF484 family protein n=1 Tax=Nitrogeniibacter mangrovi TaxID=2016596 RepID=A0A6C1B130_9RHOO|nr:DUF484 family protein [Nitrogeniibacter mangrovi]QID16615.1 DUF484 family protein [Nitrogeniibacter mangrovi]
MNTDDVVRFLHENPDFFEENAEVLGALNAVHPQRGDAISLTERQLHALREKIRQLEGKLAELIRFGEENDEISEKVHRMVLSLLDSENFEAAREAVFTHLREDFAVPHVAMRIWNSVLQRETIEFAPVSEDVRFYAGDLKHPYCGAPGNLEIIDWFGEAAPHVRSVALVPLMRDGRAFGMLAMGSEDAERFYAEMGTLYVTRIGDMVSAVMRSHLG